MWVVNPRERGATKPVRREKREWQPSHLPPSVKRVVIFVYFAFCSADQEKRETALSELENIPGHSVFAASKIAKGYGMHSGKYNIIRL